jgi:hypothetical protein
MTKPMRISWSRLKNFETCRTRTRLLNKGMGAKIVNGRPMLAGNITDRAMRQWLETGIFNPGGMHDLVPAIFDAFTSVGAERPMIWNGNPTDDQTSIINKVHTAIDILEPILLEKVTPFQFIPEFRFTTDLRVPYLDGTPRKVQIFTAMDVCVNRGTEKAPDFAIYDLKITETDEYIRKTLAQLTFYDIGMFAHFGHYANEHAYIAPLLKEPVIYNFVTNEERTAILRSIMTYCEATWKDDLYTLINDEDDWECYNCIVKKACPKFAIESDVDRQGNNIAKFSRRPK